MLNVKTDLYSAIKSEDSSVFTCDSWVSHTMTWTTLIKENFNHL